MNWFKKSIAYDQKRKLIILPFLIMIPVIFSIIEKNQLITQKENIFFNGGFGVGIGYTSYLLFLGGVTLIGLISIGLRDKSDVNYMESMPMKKHSVLMTKLSCAYIAIALPLVVGFLASTIVYIANKSVVSAEGYLYLDIVYRYISMTLIAVIILNLLYLVSSLYKNIKLPIVLVVAGALSIAYLIMILAEILGYASPMLKVIEGFVVGIMQMVSLPLDSTAAYYPDVLGVIMILLGIAVLLFFLIDYISSNFSNDIYDKLFSFKISKFIYYIITVLAIIAVFHFLLSMVIEYIYITPVIRDTNNQDQNKILLIRRVEYICSWVLIPLWIFISKKIRIKLEERF